MSDDLLLPKKGIVSLEDERENRDLEKRRPAKGFMKSFPSREEMMAAVAKGSLALGQKMYDQVSGELADNFDDFRDEMNAALARQKLELIAEMERRSLRSRVRRFFASLQGFGRPPEIVESWDPPSPEIATTATFTPGVEALPDVLPGVEVRYVTEKVELEKELRRRIANAQDGDDIKVPDGLTEQEAIAIGGAVDAEVRARIAIVRDEIEENRGNEARE